MKQKQREQKSMNAKSPQGGRVPFDMMTNVVNAPHPTRPPGKRKTGGKGTHG